jgi:HSP20 family protein
LQGASLSGLRQEMNDLLENFFGDPLAAMGWETAPRIDMSETAEAVELTVDLPGYQPDEIHLDVGEKTVTISGKHSEKKQEEEPGRRFHRVERRMGSFSRSVWLPCPVEEDKADARLENGMLKVRLPKREEAKRRRIQVRGSDL